MSENLIAGAVEVHLGGRMRSARPLSGGMIGAVYKVELDDGTPLTAKVDEDGESHLEREAYMLEYLRSESGLPVPEVFHGSKHVLLMEFVEGASVFSESAERNAADLLAGLHSITANGYGHERDTLIGSLSQPNPKSESWTEFFRDHRLLYMAEVAHRSGRLSTEDRHRIDTLAGKLEEYIETPNPPSLVHGDAWSQNVLAKGGRITAFLDPAIYFADAEMELAFISLFDSFGEAFFERYGEIRGIRPGFFEVRRDLYNLYPLLAHVYFFGGGYAGMVRRTLDRFGV